MTEIHKQYRQALTPRELYTERITTLTEEIRQLNKYNRLVVVLELSAIALAIGCVVGYTMWNNVAALVVAVLFIAAYVTIRWRDSRNSRMAEEKESLRSVYQKGTNSLDKLNGSRLFLQSVASLPVTGIIATHDLELSKMEQQYPDRFHNYCFEIRLSNEITYTYRLSEGVARNQNATYLLKNILKRALR